MLSALAWLPDLLVESHEALFILFYSNLHRCNMLLLFVQIMCLPRRFWLAQVVDVLNALVVDSVEILSEFLSCSLAVARSS